MGLVDLKNNSVKKHVLCPFVYIWLYFSICFYLFLLGVHTSLFIVFQYYEFDFCFCNRKEEQFSRNTKVVSVLSTTWLKTDPKELRWFIHSLRWLKMNPLKLKFKGKARESREVGEWKTKWLVSVHCIWYG